MRFSGAAAVAAAVGVAHLATLSRYGYYRDELYFLACAKRLAWGFVDQPPLAPALAALSLPSGGNIVLLRLACAAGAVATILLAALIARDLGAGRFMQTLAALAAALMPGSLFLGNTLTTTSLEPLTWTAAIWCLLHLQRRSSWRVAVLLAAACTVAAYMKYSIFLLLFSAFVSAVFVRERRLALQVSIVAAATALALLPNILWQAAHGFPFLAVLAGTVSGRHAFNAGPQYEFGSALANAPPFLAEQVAFAGPAAAPLWMLGLTRSRFLAAAYVIALLAALALAAKGYYLIGFYPALLAAGAASLERFSQRAQIGFAGVVAAVGIALLPFSLPVLPPRPHQLQPLFADEFGWDAMTRTVARTYARLPPQIRARTPIYADTYAVASAIEFYGPRYGLPQPLSGQNQYYVWGSRGADLSRILAVGASQYTTFKKLYRSVRLAGTYSDPYRWVLEGPLPIYLCSDPRVPPGRIWNALRWYGA